MAKLEENKYKYELDWEIAVKEFEIKENQIEAEKRYEEWKREVGLD